MESVIAKQVAMHVWRHSRELWTQTHRHRINMWKLVKKTNRILYLVFYARGFPEIISSLCSYMHLLSMCYCFSFIVC